MLCLKCIGSSAFGVWRQALVSTNKGWISLQNQSTNLKEVIAQKIPIEQEKIKKFRKEHGSTKIGDITVDMVYGGMRGLLGLVYETSLSDKVDGIRLRGFTISDCQRLLPKPPGGEQPLPEGLFWLLLTGEIPTEAQAWSVSREWASRAKLPAHVVTMLKHFPLNLHPLSQLSAAVLAMNNESKFAKAYSGGVQKSKYWEYAYEDAMDLIGNLPLLAGTIYSNLYRGGSPIQPIDSEKDWTANLCMLLGRNDPMYIEYSRMNMITGSDHEGGNVSAHATRLISSALADPYLSYSAGLNGLAGPLHGLASKEVLVFLRKIVNELGPFPTEEQLKEHVWKLLKSGQVIAGYGHAILHTTDPRYTCQREFALKHVPNDPMVKLVTDLYNVVPKILMEIGKARNPWPNVDAHTGVLHQYYGLKEENFYSVLISVSRALGVLSSLIWDRALGFPIERPKSITTNALMSLVSKNSVKN